MGRLMWQIEHLQSLHGARSRRSDHLIVGAIGRAFLDAPTWVYRPAFAFCAALDIALLERRVSGEAFLRWTQGGMLAFSAGDILHRRDGSGCIQVIKAAPIARAGESGRVDLGRVAFQIYALRDARYHPAEQGSGTQLDFLRVLIGGGP